MPQMAPMNWSILFIYFILTMYIMMNLMYFFFLKLNKNFKMKLNFMNKNYNKFI
uniref:ATP synthase complex subunit 8 n=1 Tax=Colophina clematis TaxID=133073 RepID=A0A096VKC1_9HEMI|nr:ATP synthase F0 subunit 8 [Colophina clematis]